MKNISLKDKHCNFDVGGGKYDTGTKFLEKHGVLNLIYDPYARPSEQNRRTLESLQEYPADSATVLNVLNVIPDKEERLETMRLALSLTDGPILLAVYEKKKNGVLELTTKGWQLNQPIAFYIDEIKENFPGLTFERSARIIKITKPQSD